MSADNRTRAEKLTFIAQAHSIPEEVLAAAIAEGKSVGALALEIAPIVERRREVNELAARIAAA